jgi:hypothetical protein
MDGVDYIGVEIPQHTVCIHLYIPGRMSMLPGEEGKRATYLIVMYVTCRGLNIQMNVNEYEDYKKGKCKINVYYKGTYAPIYMFDTRQYENHYIDDFVVTL